DLPQPVDEPAAGRRVAVPLVEVVRRPRGGERVGGEDGLLADDVPARPAAGQLVLQPRLLLGAEHRAVRVAPLGAGRADVAGGVAGLVAAVLAAVEQVQPGQVAPVERPVHGDAAVVGRRGPHRHVLVPGLVGGLPAGPERLLVAVGVAGVAAGVVALDLVV